MARPLSRPAAAAIILVLMPAVAQFFVAVHESGHALAALALGGTIREFHVNILSGKPHVSYTGLGSTAQAVALAAGPGLALLVWLTWLLAVRGERSVWHRKLLLIAGACALFPLVLWTVLPVLHANGRRVRDDSVSFVRLTGVSAYLVSSVALVLLLACVWLFVRRVDVRETVRVQ